MKLAQSTLCLTLLAAANLASAALTTTSNGFIDSTTNLEWLAPGKVTSLADYNSYSGNGWHVATGNQLSGMLTQSYIPFNQSLFSAFSSVANALQDFACNQTVYCVSGWYENVATDQSQSYGFEIGWIGLLSNPGQSDPATVIQQQLDIGSFYLTSTIGSYPLYGYSDTYATFMVRAVPLPAAGYMFLTAFNCLWMRRVGRHLFKSAGKIS